MKAGTYKVEINSIGNQFWYDSNGNKIHFRNSNGYEKWYDYDSNGNIIHYRDSNEFEVWREYDSDGNEIHFRNSYGLEAWYASNRNKITQKEFNRIHKPFQGKTVTIEGKEYMLVSKD